MRPLAWLAGAFLVVMGVLAVMYGDADQRPERRQYTEAQCRLLAEAAVEKQRELYRKSFEPFDEAKWRRENRAYFGCT